MVDIAESDESNLSLRYWWEGKEWSAVRAEWSLSSFGALKCNRMLVLLWTSGQFRLYL
jgi:hypothetical protein